MTQSGHIGDLSRYLLMILSGRNAVAGLDLKYAQICWITRDYPALRVESFFAVTLAPPMRLSTIACDYLRLSTLSEH